MLVKRGVVIVLGSLVCLSAIEAVQAQGKSRERYVERRLSWAENNPHWNPTREELEEQFDRLDVDGDGYLSEAEWAAERPEDRGFGARPEGLTRPQFVRQNMQWARNNPRWNPTREDLEALFDEWDTDGDGILTEEERAAGRAAREAAREDAEPAPQVAEGLTKEQFVRQRLQRARNDPRWNPTREELERRFDELDVDGDGVLTEKELEAERR